MFVFTLSSNYLRPISKVIYQKITPHLINTNIYHKQINLRSPKKSDDSAIFSVSLSWPIIIGREINQEISLSL